MFARRGPVEARNTIAAPPTVPGRFSFTSGYSTDETPPAVTALTLEQRMADVPAALRPAFVAYLNRKHATCVPKTVSSLATRLAHFGRYLAAVDPTLTSLSELDRRRHIEPFITSLTTTVNSVTGEPITVADRIRRIHAVGNFLAEITEWGWDDAPPRRLIFRTDLPRPQRFLPRYLPVDADRKLTAALSDSPYRLAADALLVQRACGLRIGELLDLELDCIHEIPGQGSWLKVPLGKLDSERMVPLDEEVLTLVDRITATRSPGRPMRPPPHRSASRFPVHPPRKTTLAERSTRRTEPSRRDRRPWAHHTASTPAHLRHRPDQRRSVAASVDGAARTRLHPNESALRTPLRHTVRTEYERALDLAKSHIGPLPTDRTPAADHRCHRRRGEWKDAPAIKSRLAGGYCLRAPAQGSCPYANICEHCPSFHTDSTHLGVLAAQRIDAHDLAADAEKRGWIDEADRHRKLISRLDALIAQSEPA